MTYSARRFPGYGTMTGTQTEASSPPEEKRQSEQGGQSSRDEKGVGPAIPRVTQG